MKCRSIGRYGVTSIGLTVESFAIKNVPRGRGYHSFPFLPYLLFRVLTALSVWGDRAEQGFHFQFSISEEARPAGMRTGYVQCQEYSVCLQLDMKQLYCFDVNFSTVLT